MKGDLEAPNGDVIQQEHVSKGAPVLIETVSVERDFLSEDKT